MKRISVLLLLVASPFYSLAEEDVQSSGASSAKEQGEHVNPPSHEKKNTIKRPTESSLDVLSLVIDYGFSRLQGQPKKMNPSFWGSRMLKGAFHYNIQIGKSPFTLSPGLGISWETYQFSKYKKEYYTFVRNSSRKTALEDAKRALQDSTDILYSQLDCTYADALLEGRFHGNSQFPKEHFFAALGFKLGMRYGTRTRVGYQEDSVIKRRTTDDPFNLAGLRYGVYGRVGWSRFGIYYNWMFSNLFNTGQGPGKALISSHHICASIDLF